MFIRMKLGKAPLIVKHEIKSKSEENMLSPQDCG